MKRNFNFMPLLVVLLFAGIGLMSCSSDDDESGTEIEHPEDNLPNEAKAFVGYWMGSGKYDFLFLGDGVCWMFDEDTRRCMGTGYWTYDVTTKILATTTGNCQWQVTLSNGNSWAGLSLDTNKPQTYTKAEKFGFFDMVLNKSTWEETSDSIISFGSYYENIEIANGLSEKGHLWMFETSISAIKKIHAGGFALDIMEDENIDDYVFQYEMRPYTKYIKGTYYYSFVPCGKGTIELKNPTSSTNMTLVFDGTIKGTFKRIE